MKRPNNLFFPTTITALKLRLAALILSALLCLFTAVSASASNNEVEHPSDMAEGVKVANAWARATFALAKTGAGYFTITNISSQDITLTEVVVAEEVAMMAELHHTVMQNDMMQMQELEAGIIIQAGSSVELSPGGMHVMFMGLSGPLVAGESLNIELHFADGSYSEHTLPIVDKRN